MSSIAPPPPSSRSKAHKRAWPVPEVQLQRSRSRSASPALTLEQLARRDSSSSPMRPPPLSISTSSGSGEVALESSRGSNKRRRGAGTAASSTEPAAVWKPSPLALEAVGGSKRRRPPPIRTQASLADVTAEVEEAPLRPRRPPREMSEVAPCLFVGSVVAARSLRLLSAHGVSHIINCCTLENQFEHLEGGPVYCKLNLSDSLQDLQGGKMAKAIRDGVAFIREALTAGGTVLVHCHKGISRSCTLAIAYLMMERRCSIEDAFEQVRAKRPMAEPNLGYLCSLREWGEHLQTQPAAPTVRKPPTMRRSMTILSAIADATAGGTAAGKAAVGLSALRHAKRSALGPGLASVGIARAKSF